MEIFTDETEYTDISMVQRIVDMFERRPRIQRIVRFGLLGMEYDDELDDTGEDDYEIDNWVHGRNNFRGYPRLSDMSSDRGFRGNHSRSSGSVYQPPLQYYTSAGDLPRLPSVKVQAKESDTERRARLLQETKKSKEKAEKKRLKKQKQKIKRNEKLERKEKLNPIKDEEGKNDAQQCKAEDSKVVNDKSKDNTNFSVKHLASAKDTESSESSEDESSEEASDAKNDSCDSEGLDMTSTFVTKAALIAKRKAEQRPRPERKEKKKIPVKERKTVPDKPKEDPEVEKKDSTAPSIPTIEDNIKISTELAVIGNGFANSGDFDMAVKCFTDAIKYNPTEFKLFGNRSFCFEKMQEYEKALTDAELCLNMYPGWVKGLFRKGRALAGLKRYEESAQAFKDVLKLESSYAEAAYELMRVQMTQLMECGYTREQSSNALIIHGTVQKALEVLSKLNNEQGAVQNATLPPAQVVNVTGVSPVLSANTNPALAVPPHPLQSQDASKTSLKNKPLGPVQNMSNAQSQPKPVTYQAMKSSNEKSQPPPELFPVWVGNLIYPVTEWDITNLFNKAGVVYSAKVLVSKRCAFVNFTKQEYCDEAIRRFHGFELNGFKIAVRYPDRIPHGMGISKSALKADDLQDENVRQNAVGSRRPVRPSRHVSEHRGNHKN
ncbi:tetratricopeptide repeat protein 31-like isoform X2 [Xiphias gladius]|uniref:tetratricopeptide repeat protein 31-like isoform X2 n=2 Tax=Xiphias gladius TaxID=8245 RepID=UPI001A980B92|nr:tetratricopeptide repeat protein 31-like isoform X2 [Xiphias gladius]